MGQLTERSVLEHITFIEHMKDQGSGEFKTMASDLGQQLEDLLSIGSVSREFAHEIRDRINKIIKP